MERKTSWASCFFLGCCLLIVGLLSGCAPRGETKTLDEVFHIAKTRYEESVIKSHVSSEVKTQLVKLVGNLQLFLQVDSVVEMKRLSAEISSDFGTLVTSAGYTTRPALGEIAKSFRGVAALSEGAEGAISVGGQSVSGSSVHSQGMGAGARKLLVARSFTTLAQELETTSFQVNNAGV